MLLIGGELPVHEGSVLQLCREKGNKQSLF